MQTRAVCFLCRTVIEHSPVFAAPCDHQEHPSAVWHGICLMEWREKYQDRMKEFRNGIEVEDDDD